MKNIQPAFRLRHPFVQLITLLKICGLLLLLQLLSVASQAQEFKIYSGVNVVLDGNVFFVVNNTALKNDGTFTPGTSTVSFTGNSDTSVAYLDGASNTRFYNLTLNKSAYGFRLRSAAGVQNVLTAVAGTLYSDSSLTLLSDASNTARLATVPSGANVVGKAMVERYIPSRRAWRLMTAPVTDASSIYDTWQNGGAYAPGRGLLVSGPGASNGLDNGNAASLKTWDVSGQTLSPVLNTYNSISATNNGSADNTGYFVFVRGDRCICNFTIPNTNVTTLTGIGRLQIGTQTFIASAVAGKYTLVGNPYASPINFNSLSRTNLVKRFYVWDPTLNALGGYVTLDDLDNDGLFTKSVAGSAQTKEIQSSQAFFVETNSNGAALLTVSETAKSTTNNLSVFRPFAPTSTESIRADLYLLQNDSSVILADGVLAEYNDVYHDSVTNEDALKFTNINETFGTLRYGTALAIERRPFISSRDTLFFKLWKTTQRNYQLKITPENFGHPGMIAWLQDSYLSTSTPVNLTGITTINFTIDTNPAAAVSNRFRIVFSPAVVLPVNFTQVKAYQLNDKIAVEWKAADETNTTRYEVERSADGTNFSIVNNSFKNATGKYEWTDVNPFAGKNFYRIKGIDRDGTIRYSNIVNVLMVKGIAGFTIEPNPVHGNQVQVHFANQPGGTYQFSLTNSAGQLVYTNKHKISNNSTVQTLSTSAALPAGVYQLQINGPSNITETQKVIVTQ